MLDEKTKSHLRDAFEAWSAASNNAISLQHELMSLDIERTAVEERLSDQERLRDNAAALVNETLEDIPDTDDNVSEIESIAAPYIGSVGFKMAVLP